MTDELISLVVPSFHFSWPRFSDQFHAEATQMLNAALNKGSKPRIIADKIEVVELSMGTQPPELEIRDIGELTTDQFRGIFRLSYAGDAHIVLRTKVQANPLNHKRSEMMDVMGSSRGILAAHQPLVVPMLLRLSHFRLNAYVVLVLSKQKGITLVFKTDPLQNVDVNSTFDSIAVIQKFIQKEIEGQLREMFREDLPAIIHRLSQRWTAGRTKVEAPYLQKNPTTLPREKVYTPSSAAAMSERRVPLNTNYTFPTVGLPRPGIVPRPLSLSHVPINRPRLATANSTRSHSSKLKASTSASSATLERTSSFPDLENYDPTYGLRPEGLPSKSGYSGFGRLFGSNKGLADLGDLVEESQDADDRTDAQTFDMIEWDDTAPDYSTHPPSVAEESETEYETLPAVGGGTITRPRVYHSQSLIGLPTDAVPKPPSRSPSIARSLQFTPLHHNSSPGHSPIHPRSSRRRLDEDSVVTDPVSAWREQQLRQSYLAESSVPGPSRSSESPVPGPSKLRSSYSAMSYSDTLHPDYPTPRMTPDPSFQDVRRLSTHSDLLRSSSSSYTRMSHSSGPPPTVSTPPSSDVPGPDDDPGSPRMGEKARRRSLSPSMMRPFDPMHLGSPPKDDPETKPTIILRPNINTVSHLSTLSQSNHTLSPYTHSLEHFTVRSFPPRPPRTPDQPVPVCVKEQKPVRARRKRTFHIGGKGKQTADPAPPVTTQHHPPSEFSDEVDYYFKADDDTSSLRRRSPQPQPS
ncbi:ERMES complex subunit [Tulasnella sp. 403]|nr:ERMES complex subunit [Tulasnella sp. 403]